MFWCPDCKRGLREITSEDLECICGFISRKIKEKKDSFGMQIYRESYRVLEKVYEWFPAVLTRKPNNDSRESEKLKKEYDCFCPICKERMVFKLARRFIEERKRSTQFPIIVKHIDHHFVAIISDEGLLMDTMPPESYFVINNHG